MQFLSHLHLKHFVSSILDFVSCELEAFFEPQNANREDKSPEQPRFSGRLT